MIDVEGDRADSSTIPRPAARNPGGAEDPLIRQFPGCGPRSAGAGLFELCQLAIEFGNRGLEHLAMSWGGGPRKIVLRPRARQLERAAPLPQRQSLGTSRRPTRRTRGLLLLRFYRLRLPPTRHTSTISGDPPDRTAIWGACLALARSGEPASP